MANDTPAEAQTTSEDAPVSMVTVTSRPNAVPPPKITPPAVQLPTMTVPGDQQQP